MLKVHKGRRDDVRTVHGPPSGPASPIPYLISLAYESSATGTYLVRECILWTCIQPRLCLNQRGLFST